MGAPFRSLPPPLLSNRYHCGYKQMPLRLQIDTPATTNRYHCGDKQMPLRRQADATAATSRNHCGYKQMPLRLHTVNKTADRPNIRHHSCPTSSHTLYSRSSSPRRMIPSAVSAWLTMHARRPNCCRSCRVVLHYLDSHKSASAPPSSTSASSSNTPPILIPILAPILGRSDAESHFKSTAALIAWPYCALRCGY